MTTIDINTLTRDERGIILYAECCMVDYGGLLEGVRMNAEDLKALDKFKAHGLLDYGRIPSKLLCQMIGRSCTHWVEFTDAAWDLAHQLRRRQCERSRSSSTNYAKVRAELDARASD